MFDFFGMPIGSALLCYPSTGLFPLPIIGAPSGYALPVHPRYLFAVAPKGWLELFVQFSRSEKERDRTLVALSCGTWMASQVVLPPALHSRTEAEQRTFIHSSRDIGKAIAGKALRLNYRAFGTISPGSPRKIPLDWCRTAMVVSRYKHMDEYAGADLKAHLESLPPQGRIEFVKTLGDVRWMPDAPKEALTEILAADESVAVRAWAARTLGFDKFKDD